MKLRCLLAAGRGTNHFGWGECNIHEGTYGSPKNRKLRLLAGYQASGLALQLKELNFIVPDLLSDPAIGELDEEIVVLTMMLQNYMNNPFGVIDYKAVLLIVDGLTKTKRARQSIKTEKLLMDVSSIRLFLEGIFEVLADNLGRAQFSQVAAAIGERVPFPINKAMQELIGSETLEIPLKEIKGEIVPIAAKVYNAIDDKEGKKEFHESDRYGNRAKSDRNK